MKLQEYQNMISVKLRTVDLTEHIPLCYGSIEKNYMFFIFSITES